LIFKLEDDKQENYLSKAFFGFFIIILVRWLFPDIIPYSLFEFWNMHDGGLMDWLITAWPIFAWAAGVNIIHYFFADKSRRAYMDAEKLFGAGLVSSLWAGVMEEICFRWLIFLSGIWGIKFANFIFFGFLGFGIPEWTQIHLWGPLANFATLGYLNGILTNPSLWAVGASLLATNAFFRDGHKYQGWLGYVNSWFIGMFMFWVLFKYGLVACITIHFAYDAIIDITLYCMRVVERQFSSTARVQVRRYSR
jgi:hypothetical protein